MKYSFEQLCADALEKIKEFGIKSQTVIRVFDYSCRLLKRFLKRENIEFSFENGQRWLSEINPNAATSTWRHHLYLSHRRAVFLLAECQEGKLTEWKIYSGNIAARPSTEEYLQLIYSHEQKLQFEGMAKETIKFAMRVDSDFLIYLEESEKFKINEIIPSDVIGYFALDKFSGRKPDGVKAYAYKLKSFLTFLEAEGLVTEKKLSLAVPKVFAKQESIVTVLSDKAVKMIRERNLKSGAGTIARDYAMMLLALRLGIRRSDIIKMKLSDIDWKNDKISFIQQKTKVAITLPLLPDVGNALMAYILNFRPKVINETIFLRYCAPYQELSPCSWIVAKNLSDFDCEDCPQRGFHIMRRTFATKMLRNNIRRSVILAAIGQLEPHSVDVYLSADEKNMRKCALTLKGIECQRRDLR